MTQDENALSEEQYAEILRLPQASVDRIVQKSLPQGVYASKVSFLVSR